MKNKTKNFILLAMGTCLMMSAAVFTSCSQDDSPVAGTSQDGTNVNAIGFNAYVNNAEGTRALPTDAANYKTQVKDFKVWGFFTDSTVYYLGAEGTGGIYITHTSGQDNWDYKTATDVVNWPTDLTKTLDFYAVTPSDNDNYVFSGQTLTYTVPTDQSKQVDLMVARAAKQTKSTANGKVGLAFQHQLSQIVFQGTTLSSNMSVEIKGITIHNVRNNMAIAFAGTATQPAAALSNYAVGLATSKTLNSTTQTVSLTDNNGTLLLVPQTLTPWADGTTIAAADGAKQAYLEIECKVTSKTSSGTTYLIGSATAYGKTYIPINATWTAGQKYTYTLKFGGKNTAGGGVGKDDKGTVQTTPITFTVSVSDWTGNNNADVDM